MKEKSGFTLIEILVILGLVTIIFVLGLRSLSAIERQDRLKSWTEEVISALIYAKVQALNGASLGGSDPLSFGVHFNENEFILFPGITFQPGDSRNLVYPLPSSLHFALIDLPPGEDILFRKLTGEITNFDPLYHEVVLKEKNGQRQRTISVNKQGVVEISN